MSVLKSQDMFYCALYRQNNVALTSVFLFLYSKKSTSEKFQESIECKASCEFVLMLSTCCVVTESFSQRTEVTYAKWDTATEQSPRKQETERERY